MYGTDRVNTVPTCTPFLNTAALPVVPPDEDSSIEKPIRTAPAKLLTSVSDVTTDPGRLALAAMPGTRVGVVEVMFEADPFTMPAGAKAGASGGIDGRTKITTSRP